MKAQHGLFSHLGKDVPASIVVFLVALPLCLGIALASGAPPFSGIIAGLIGGIVVAGISKSSVSVSGPAAGLTVIVLSGIQDLGNNFQAFLLVVAAAGIFQILFGIFRLGIIGYWFPSSVIRGMLAAIGLILIMKQIPHGVGYDKDFEGDESFIQPDNENTFSEILNAFNFVSPSAVIICIISMAILVLFDTKLIKQFKVFQFIPGSLIVVILGIVLNEIFTGQGTGLSGDHLVNLPVAGSTQEFFGFFSSPDWSALSNYTVYVLAIKLAIVASLETLLSVEAADKIDPFKRVTPTNRELIAQGSGNLISGLIGGLPITAVIVRSSANVNSGARTKMSAIFHGMWLLIAVAFLAPFINKIPNASLAAILLMTGYKLSKPALYKEAWSRGMDHFMPFIVTIVAILFSDLLIGIGIGMAVGIYYVARTNFKTVHRLHQHNDNYLLRFYKDVTFMNKAAVMETLENIPDNVTVIIDGRKSDFIDDDIIEALLNFQQAAELRGVRVILEGIPNYKDNIKSN
jgi:MFS superfamily sulfate permease-like transporter